MNFSIIPLVSHFLNSMQKLFVRMDCQQRQLKTHTSREVHSTREEPHEQDLKLNTFTNTAQCLETHNLKSSPHFNLFSECYSGCLVFRLTNVFSESPPRINAGIRNPHIVWTFSCRTGAVFEDVCVCHMKKKKKERKRSLWFVLRILLSLYLICASL